MCKCLLRKFSICYVKDEWTYGQKDMKIYGAAIFAAKKKKENFDETFAYKDEV